MNIPFKKRKLTLISVASLIDLSFGRALTIQ
jgi:hypothetical protein